MTTTQNNGGAREVSAEIPRVTPEQVEAAIRKEEYHLHGRTTVCILTLDNDLTVTGINHGSVDPRLFNEEMGRKMARGQALNDVWARLGFRLGDQLAKIRSAPTPTGEITQFGKNCSAVKTYVGTKVVHAVPMRRGPYNELRGWKVPENENPADEGYLVEYADGGKPNVEGFAGYISWSPKDVFERAYTTCVAVPPAIVKDFIARMEDEFNELTDKLGKLNVFRAGDLFPTLPYEDRRDMTDQAQAMDDYAWALRRRLRRAQERKAKAAEQAAQ